MRFMPAIAVAAAVSVGLVAQETKVAKVSETARLEKMTARFAPTSIRADLSSLSAADKHVLAKLVEASKMLDALFLRQVWVGNEAMLLDLARDPTPEGRARLHYFLINKGPWSRLDHDEVFVPGAPPKPAGANFYPGRRDQSRDRAMDPVAARGGTARRPRASSRPSAAAAAASASCRTTSSIRPSCPRGGAAARGRGARDRADAQDVPDEARRRASLERLLRQRRGVDGAEGHDRADDSARTRSTRTSCSTTRRRSKRSSRCRTKPSPPSCRSSPASCRTSRIICRSIRSTATRSSAPSRRIVVVNEIFAAGDANRGVQTAAFNLPNDERVTREKGAKRVMLKNVQDAKFAKTLVPDLESRAVAGGSEGPVLRRFLHAHRRPRADARAWTAQHHRRRTPDHRAAGDEGSLELSRGSQGRHLRPLRDPVPDRQRRAAEVARAPALHDVSGVGVPVDPLRHQRSARPRHGRAVELPARPGRVRRPARRHVRGRSGEGQGRRRRRSRARS